ncbi:hypothetical protein O7626_40600 [Micromonospora sp. WMMD1102]|uniref:hypothetical protein n=1 Tax=Micromonospora sp. WMMD1102 TaxID=3016105 RepID=UPI002414D51D|nr:hypothetical protein [Micromonospora sp. WMMD1102]MDG4792118.1 hypothetical protein [Micromonospora sp. WMMD1102]
MAEKTPIPAGPSGEPYPGAAEVRKLALNTFWPMVERRANELGWAVSEVVDERMLAAVNNALYAVGGAAYAAGLAAGRTPPTNSDDLYLSIAVGIDPVDPEECAVSPTFRAAVDAAVAAGRTAAAEDRALLDRVREHIGNHGDGEVDVWSLRELLAGRPTDVDPVPYAVKPSSRGADR